MTAPTWFPAPAKINLALHVTGQRADGYHLIETIAVFADVGDRIAIQPLPADAFHLAGPEADALHGEDPATNLVVRARDLLRSILAARGRNALPVAITLDKRLPAGSGIGGGSADAAATLRALAGHWSAGDMAGIVAESAVTLGADVPMCLASRPLFAAGVGEAIHPIGNMPALSVVLANPRRHVSTPKVFSALAQKDNPPIPLTDTALLDTAEDWAAWLGESCRNDLQAPSVHLAPEIDACLRALAATTPLLARMSGSGATCFGIYGDMDAAHDAATRLLQAHPDWWITAATTGASPGERP